MAQLDLIITPTRVFEDNTQSVFAAANVPNSQLVVTASEDKLVRLWDLKTGQVLKKMGGHTSEVVGLAVSRDGQMIATGDKNGELIVWSGKNGEPITKAMKAHDNILSSLDFQRDGPFLITASSTPSDQTMKFWNTDTWTLHTSIQCGSTVRCVRFSVSGTYYVAVATDKDIQIYARDNTEPIFRSSHSALSLAWYPDGTRLLSGGDDRDPSIREWDTSSWTQVGLPWTGHIYNVNSIAVNSSSTHAVSASNDHSVRLWQLSDKRTIAIFQHTSPVLCTTFSADGMQIISGGADKKVIEWAAPNASKEKAPGSNSNAQESAPTQPAPKVISNYIITRSAYPHFHFYSKGYRI